MARSVDVAVLGSGIRGIWLSTELAKLGWSVTWIQLQAPNSTHPSEDFEYDDWPWQLGQFVESSRLSQLTENFITKIIRPESQDIAVQILTPKGPLELSGGLEKQALKKFFKVSHYGLQGFINSIHEATKLGSSKGMQLISAHAQKVFNLPLGKRWVLEWLGSLRLTRSLETRDWILKWEGQILDPNASLWILKDGMHETVERAVSWAEKQGVTVHREARVAGIDVDGKQARGIVFDRAEGYLQCERMIFSCSCQLIENKFPKFMKSIVSPIRSQEDEKWVWIRSGYYLKPNSKPAGLMGFSTFAMDPLMPLMNENFGSLRWKTFQKGDSLTVWTRVSVQELKRKSFLTNLHESIQKNLEILFPWFSRQLIMALPFEDHLSSSSYLGHDELSYVFSEHSKFQELQTRLKNVYLAGPEFDRGSELMSQFATELKIIEKLAEIRLKELPRDRALYTPGNGQNMVHSK